MDNLLTRLSDLSEWADANEYEVPINLGDTLREAAEEIRKLTAERDAAVEDLRFQHDCDQCKNKEVSDNCQTGICDGCTMYCPCRGCNCGEKWEWRGCTRSGAKHIEIEGVIPDGEDTDEQ